MPSNRRRLLVVLTAALTMSAGGALADQLRPTDALVPVAAGPDLAVAPAATGAGVAAPEPPSPAAAPTPVAPDAAPAAPAAPADSPAEGGVAATAPARPGLERLLSLQQAGLASDRAIVSLDAVATPAVIAVLRGLGLEVQPFEHLPLAVVRGPAAALVAAADTGLVADVWPDERIELLDTASSDSIGGAAARAAGLTGAGVTVAVVDSGCDATHPDLADHVVHNVKILSPEYANLPPDGLVVPVELPPGQNTDLGSGHGTHVAGIIAADGTTGPEHLGVAPDAELVCYSIGEVLFTTAVVSAYDHLLDQPDLWGVDVVNNSWGNTYTQFDPRNPVAVATRAVADQGVTIVFAAGNNGEGETEATLNPFSQAPWVISVAATSLDHERGGFSSNGLRYDNSSPVAIGGAGHTTFLGDRIGLVHPDVSGPGVDIGSSCDSVAAAVGPCLGSGDQIQASGTSMASPHVAGAAAVLLQARPGLTPDQVREALQVTTTRVRAADGSGRVLPFWQVGYGEIDIAAAADLVRSADAPGRISRLQRQADLAVAREVGALVVRSDFFTHAAPAVSLGTDVRTLSVPIQVGVTHVKVTVAFPTETGLAGDVGLTSYSVTVRDGAGAVVGTTERGAGTASLLVQTRGSAPGTWTFELVGDRSLSDPDTIDSDSVLGDTVTLQVAQLASRTRRS